MASKKVILMDVYKDADLCDPLAEGCNPGDQSPPPALLKPSSPGPKDFVTVVSVEDPGGPQPEPDNFVTVLEVNEASSGVEEVLVYRLPGERLGMALKFVGGTTAGDNVSRVFIQSITPESPASRAQWKLSPIKEGDEILEISDSAVTSMTRLDCVTLLRDSPVCIKLLLRHQADAAGRPRKNPPPPIPPRKSSIGAAVVNELPLTPTTSVRQHVELFEKHASGLERTPSLKRPSIPPPLPPRRPKSSCSEEQPATPFPGMSVSMRLPGWEELMRKRGGGGDKGDRPVQPDLYVDLLAEEEKKLLECESDDTGSSVSTVIEKFSRASTANSSFSEHTRQQSLDRPLHTFDLEKVLSPFEQLERELDGQEETCVDDDEQDLDFVDDPGILNDGKDALCDVLGLPSAIAPPESFQDLSSSPQHPVNGDLSSEPETECRLTSDEDQESRAETLSPLEEQEECSDQDGCAEPQREEPGNRDLHAAAAMALDKLLQLESAPTSLTPRCISSRLPIQKEISLLDVQEAFLRTNELDDKPIFDDNAVLQPAETIGELISFARVTTTQQYSSSTVVSVNRHETPNTSSRKNRDVVCNQKYPTSPSSSEIASSFRGDRLVSISPYQDYSRDDSMHNVDSFDRDHEIFENDNRTFQSTACVFVAPRSKSEQRGITGSSVATEGGSASHAGSWDRDGSPDLVPTSDTHPSAYRNDADGSVASATEDIVMEARLLDDPFSTPDDPSGVLEEHPCLLDDPSGVSSGTFLDRTGKRVDLCDASRDECDLLGLNDMDTIPEEETSSATSELSTETSHLESDRSELGDLSSSESPVPRETGDDVSEDDCKADAAVQPTTRKSADAVAAGHDPQVLSPIEPEAASPSEERREKSRTPDSEDLMSSDEGSFPSLLLRRLPPDGHEFPNAYSEPSLVLKDPPSEDVPLKKPVHVYEDSGIFSDDPLSSLSASEGEEKTKVAVTKSNKESRQGDGRAVADVGQTDGTSSDDRETESPAGTPPVGESAEPAKEDGTQPTTFASMPLPVPLPQYCSPLMPDRRASAEATQKRYSGMLASMLETTKFGTKLKGLVIPDKPKASSTVTKTMPVIVSNPIPSSVVLLEDAKPRRELSPPPKHTTLLADPPWKAKEASDVPKYSPAFKRRSLQVSKSLEGPSLRTGAQNGFQFSLTHSKPVTPVLPETPVMSPPPLSYTSSGTRSRSNSSSSTFSNPSSSGCSLETTRKSRLDSFGVTEVDQNQPVITAVESVTNGTSYTQSPLLERYLSSSSYDNKTADARVTRQGSVKSTSSSDARAEKKSFTNGDVPSSKYGRQRKNSAEMKRLSSVGSTESLTKSSTTVSSCSSPPKPTRSPNTETRCDESVKSSKTWEVTSLKDSKKKFRSMDDRSWNSQFRRHSYEQPAYSVRVSSSSSLNIDQKAKSVDSKESPSEAWQKSVRASQLGQQKTVLKKTIDSADSAKSFKALAQKWEQRSQDAQVNYIHPIKKDTTAVVNGKAPVSISPTAQRHHASTNGRATGSSSPDVAPVQLRSPRSPVSRPSSMYEERDKPRLSPEWTEAPSSSYLRSKPAERPVSVAYRSTKNCSSYLSVNDIKKAFESEVAKVPPRTLASLRVMRSEQQLPLPEHRRFSSIDSNDSGNSTASREQYSSMTSLASTSSLISPQELQQLIDEANQSLDEAGASGHDIHVVILHKDSPTSGLGVTLAGGSDYETKEITVHKVIAGGLADRDGRIRKSDRILSINGKTMKNVTHKDAIDILKSPRQEVVLVLSREGRQSVRTTPNISRASSLSSVLDVVDEPEVAPTTAAEAQQAPAPTKQEKIVLVKDGLGLGFTLEGGKDSPLGDKPLVIKRIFRGGAAERDGRLQVGSELISINSQVVSSMTRTEAWNFLKKLPDGPLTLVVSGRAS